MGTPATRKNQRTAATNGDSSSPASSGRFQRLEVLGAGTFGVVYRARDRRTGEIVAVKCLRASDGAGDAERYLSDFASEVSALEACSGHPSIVQPRASGQLDSGAFLAMEFVGPTLRHVMKHVRFGRRHTELEVRLLMRQLLAGERRMNRLGLMQRDLKTENPREPQDLRPRAIVQHGRRPPYSNPIGTRGYRVPEILLGSTDYDERVDSWALGVMMAELLAGRHPFHGRSDMDHLSEILALLGTADIKEWSGYDGRRLPSGCQLGSFLRNKFPCPTKARIKGPPTLSEAGFEIRIRLSTPKHGGWAAYSNPIGTLGYRALEILLGSTDYDKRVDSWALGVMMTELLAGQHPFHGRTDMEHLSEILDLLGTVDIKEWSGYDWRRLPGGCQLGSFLRSKFPCPTQARTKGPPTLSEAGFEVLSGLLRCNPEKRLTAEQALKHRWFKDANPRATRVDRLACIITSNL
uniref:[RNA-polymerase]-subunit kinase n=1 Tax=Aegilops tauschii TaxID=37682 RepID=M8C8Y6_AEGTA